MKDGHVRDERVLVYSTDGDLPLPKAPTASRKPQPSALRRAQGDQGMPDDGVLRVAREKRRNSAVTIVHGLAPAELEAAGKELRRLCGTGGTAKNGVVELQGDHREKIVAHFEERGRRVKRAGG